MESHNQTDIWVVKALLQGRYIELEACEQRHATTVMLGAGPPLAKIAKARRASKVFALTTN